MTSVSQGIFERLFNLYLIIALLVGALVIGWLLYSMWAFRARPDSPRPFDAPVPGILPAERGRALWSWVLAIGIAAIMFGLAFSTISAVDTLEKPPVDRQWQHHNVTGFQFGWKYNYTGVGGIPFQKIGSWTVPVDTVIVLNVTSQDVWHNYALTDFRMRVDAIPGEITKLWFEAKQTGSFPNVCVQLCGTSHALMKADMFVVSQAEYDAYLQKESKAAYEAFIRDAGRNPARGSVVHLNLTDGGVEPGAETLQPGKAVVFNVTNEGASPVTVTLGAHSATILPGTNGGVYAPAPLPGARLVLTTSTGQQATYQVVSS